MAGIKPCSICGQFKTPDAFGKKSARCKPCAVDVSRQWRIDNPERARHHSEIYRARYAGSRINGHRLKYRYGISLDDHKAMAEAQGGKCAICQRPFTQTPHVDHCHDTGKIRGLLCDKCNRGIGYFCDSPDSLISAAKYLKDHAE